MRVYCTSKNSGPGYPSHGVYMLYLGTSLKKAQEAVGGFSKYRKPEYELLKKGFKLYSALPGNMEWQMVRLYMADGWWYSIVAFELEEDNAT